MSTTGQETDDELEPPVRRPSATDARPGGQPRSGSRATAVTVRISPAAFAWWAAPHIWLLFRTLCPDAQATEWHGVLRRPLRSASWPYGQASAARIAAAQGQWQDLIIIGAASLAVILMAVLAVVVATRGGPQANPGGSAQDSRHPLRACSTWTLHAFGCVSAYLQAVAAGDAAPPCPTQPIQPQGSLTNEVLAESQNRAPLAEINVPVVEDQNATSVSATYTLDNSSVTESFDVVKVADGWRLSRAVKDLDLGFIVGGSVPVKINGVQVEQDSVAVLPGSYAFTTGLPYVGYGSKNVVLVKSPYVEADTYRIQSQLTSSGKKAVISATKKSFKKCLNANSLNPKNCPMKFDSKYRYTKSTITWQQTGSDPFRKPKVSFSGTQAQIQIPLNLKLTGSCRHQADPETALASSPEVGRCGQGATKPLNVRWL